MSLFFKRKSETKEKIGHIIAGVIILVHAYEKFDLHESSYIFFLIAGIIFLSIAVFHHRLHDVEPEAPEPVVDVSTAC